MMRTKISFKQALHLAENVCRLKINNRNLKPLIIGYYVTLNCNYNCSYCCNEHLIKKGHKTLSTEDSIRLLRIIKNEVGGVNFSGGEPLLRRDIVELLKSCKSMGMKPITLFSNMSLIHKKMEVLDYVTQVVASLHSLSDDKLRGTTNVPLSALRQTKKNIVKCAKLQKQKDFQLYINCVITPESINDAREVMGFCFQHNIKFTPSPAALLGGEIDTRLKNNNEYVRFIDDVIVAKNKGKPVFAPWGYLEGIRSFKQFECYPSTSLRINPDGNLVFPCDALGSPQINALEVGSVLKALEICRKKFQNKVQCRDMCFMGCYMIPSLLVKNPFLFIKNYKELM